MISIKRKTLEGIKLRLDAQKTLFADPEFINNVPLIKRPLMSVERRGLKKLIKEVDKLLKE